MFSTKWKALEGFNKKKKELCEISKSLNPAEFRRYSKMKKTNNFNLNNKENEQNSPTNDINKFSKNNILDDTKDQF